MVTIKHKVTLKTKTPQEETSESVYVKKVTLKKKQAESSVVAEPKQHIKPDKSTCLSAQGQEKNSNTGKIFGGIIATVAIFAGVYFFGIKGNDTSDENQTGASAEVIVQNDGNTAKETADGFTVAGDNASTGEEGSTRNTSEATGSTEGSEISAENAKNMPATNASSSIQTDGKNAEGKSAVTPSASCAPLIASSAPISGNVEENARRVIRGDFGNGQMRKDKLGIAYSEIQGKVNEMYRQGLVK